MNVQISIRSRTACLTEIELQPAEAYILLEFQETALSEEIEATRHELDELVTVPPF